MEVQVSSLTQESGYPSLQPHFFHLWTLLFFPHSSSCNLKVSKLATPSPHMSLSHPEEPSSSLHINLGTSLPTKLKRSGVSSTFPPPPHLTNIAGRLQHFSFTPASAVHPLLSSILTLQPVEMKLFKIGLPSLLGRKRSAVAQKSTPGGPHLVYQGDGGWEGWADCGGVGKRS